MSRTYVIDVPQSVIDYLQRLAFELQNYRDNLAYLLDTRRDDAGLLESAAFKKYQDLTAKRNTEYELAKQEASTQLIPKEFDLSDLSWIIDFKWSEMRITVSKKHNVDLAEKLGLQLAGGTDA